jgi:4-hydroxybenzoate polyprenyltransferase
MEYMTIQVYFSACRLESWLSWVFNFALGSIIFALPHVERFIPLLLAFAFATAYIFVINQYFDREADKHNRIKSTLPLASERMTSRDCLIFSSLLIFSCIILVLLTNIRLLPYFVAYLALWTAYSAPVPNFKSIPVLDFIVSGIGAGFLPFYMGLGTANRLDVGVWPILLIAVPLMLFQSGGHIIQAVGDYEADRDFGLKTFAVNYGPKRATALAGLFFSLALISPFMYLYLGLLYPSHLILVVVILPLSLPVIRRFIDLYKEPAESNAVNLKKTARNIGIFALIIVWTYVLVIKAL